MLEEAGDVEIALPEGFEMLERRDYGETQVLLLKAEPAKPWPAKS